MTITALPTPPTRSDPANFAVRADAFLAALPAFGTEANALASDVNAKQATASSAATTATTQATTATTQAGIATTQADIATTQAGLATTAKDAAVAAKDAAELALDQFTDLYLGPKASDPTADNDGNALAEGAFYWNTVNKELRFWNSTTWVAPNISGTNYLAKASNLSDLGSVATARTNLDVPTRTGGDASGTWGINITGNAATVNNGVYTTGNQTIAGSKTFSSTIVGSISGNAATATTAAACSGNSATVTNGVYTTGDQTIAGVKTFSSSLNVAASTVTIGVAGTGTGGTIYHKNDAGTNLWATGFLAIGGATNYLWYNIVAGATRMTLDTAGNLTAAGNVTAYSDERLKRNWTVLGKDFIEQLSLVKHGTYERIDSGERQVGVSAQALREVLPEAVLEGDDGTLSVAYGNAALVAAVKLAERVVALEARLAALEAR